MIGDLARERLVGEQECLREVEQRRPQLILDLGTAVGVLDILRGKCLAQSGGAAVGEEQGLESPGRASRRLLGDDAKFGQQRRMHRQWVVFRKRREPTLGRLDVGHWIATGIFETEHGSIRLELGLDVKRKKRSIASRRGVRGNAAALQKTAA
jgi:hypothetical protein